MSSNSAHRLVIDSRSCMAQWVQRWLVLGLILGMAGCGGGESPPDATPPARPTDPLAIDTPPPVYPMALACAGQGGEPVLVLSLDAKGQPADVRIERSSRRRALDDAAVAAVRTWRFKPATSGGTPVAARIRVPVKFTPPVMRPDACFQFDEQQRRSQ